MVGLVPAWFLLFLEDHRLPHLIRKSEIARVSLKHFASAIQTPGVRCASSSSFTGPGVFPRSPRRPSPAGSVRGLARPRLPGRRRRTAGLGSELVPALLWSPWIFDSRGSGRSWGRLLVRNRLVQIARGRERVHQFGDRTRRLVDDRTATPSTFRTQPWSLDRWPTDSGVGIAVGLDQLWTGPRVPPRSGHLRSLVDRSTGVQTGNDWYKDHRVAEVRTERRRRYHCLMSPHDICVRVSVRPIDTVLIRDQNRDPGLSGEWFEPGKEEKVD